MCALRIKLKMALTLLASGVLLSGCVHEYILKLKDGDQILSLSKPKLEKTGYRFTDRGGEEHVIPRNRVVKIQAVPVVTDQEKAPEQPRRPRHWYFLWLA
jgi:hypothetical protein